MRGFSDTAKRNGVQNGDSEYQEYLLGGLSARRRVAIEQTMVVDDQVFDSLRAAEEELVQGYAEGSLRPDVLKRFESLIRSSAAWQRKVRLAKALLSIAPHAKKSVARLPELAAGPNVGVERAARAGGAIEFAGFEALLKSKSNRTTHVLMEDKAVREQLAAIARNYLTPDRHPGHDVAVLVDEALLRLGSASPPIEIQDERRFIIAVVGAMRRVVIDSVRERMASLSKGMRLSQWERDILGVDAAFRDLEAADPRASRVVELIFFGGLSIEAAAAVLGVDKRTVRRDFTVGKTFIRTVMKDRKAQP